MKQREFLVAAISCAIAWQASAATLFHNGRIHTMDAASSTVEALLAEDGRIVALGNEADMAERASANDRRIDLEGHTVLPGFIDTHVHFLMGAMADAWIDVSGFRLETLEQVQQRLREALPNPDTGDWIVGFGYDANLIAPHRHLRKEDLDAVSTERPVAVIYQSGHFAAGNSKALQLAGITRETPEHLPGGGIVARDASGEPSGLLLEGPAVTMLMGAIPQDHSQAALARMIDRGARHFARSGYTTINDNGAGFVLGAQEAGVLAAYAHRDDALLRFSVAQVFEIFAKIGEPLPWDGRFQASAIKFWADASATGGTAAMDEPYPDGSRGLLNHTQADLERDFAAVMDRGYAVAVHTNGDRAHTVVLDAFAAAMKGRQGTFLHRIEHASFPRAEHLARMRELGLMPSFLMNTLYYWGDMFARDLYGAARSARLSPLASTAKAGVPFSLHSDYPVTPTDPMLMLRTAVTRQTRGGTVIGESERIDVERGLHALGIDAARVLGIEADVGSLEPGKFADMVVLDGDPFAVEPAQLTAIRVLYTVLGGEPKREL